MTNFGDEEAIRFIKRHLDGYTRGGSGGGSGGGRGGSNSSMSESDTILHELACVHEMIEDFFAEKGLDPRSLIESQRRGGGGR